MDETESAIRQRLDASIRADRWRPLPEQPIITLQQHILQEQKRFPGASGEFSWLLSGITLATKMIQAKVKLVCTTRPICEAWFTKGTKFC